MTALPARGLDPRLVQVSIRRSTAGDRETVAALARLDGAPPPDGDEYLLAEEDGVLRAARPLAGGRAIADPFHSTADLVAMLELRASRMVPDGGASRRSRGLRSPAPRWGRRRTARSRGAASGASRIGLSGSAAGRT
ncbi:MAG: hypothetical protein H0W05_04625 [Thermoleophilaceae bacterium]|nr:hypothetical protein [Thermoleophilaceae bacterium]